MDDVRAGGANVEKRPRNQPRLKPPNLALHNYANFPAAEIDQGETWFRNHQLRARESDFGVWYFASRTPEKPPEGRFDLSFKRKGIEQGTCYLASTVRAAVNELLGPDYFDRGFVDGPLLNGRVVSEVQLPERVRVADATSPGAFNFLVNSELFDTDNYELTQEYANRFAEDGFGGIKSGLRFSTDNSVGLALFGAAGVPSPKPTAASRPLDVRMLVEKWGIRIEDVPSYASVDVIA